MLPLFLYLLVFPNFVSADLLTLNFTAEYEIILKEYKGHCAKKKCFFGEPEITQKTMEKWPTKCFDVCLMMVLNENLDVPLEMWKEKLNKTDRIMGGIWIANTSLENLDFIIKPDLLIFTDFNPFVIQNNSKLTNGDPILGMIPQSINTLSILDNPIFDATSFCNSYDYDSNGLNKNGWKIRGNKVDCNCRAEKLTSKNLLKYTDCEHIGGSLIITNLEDQIPTMSKVKKIGGTLEVRNTNLKNLSFFESLEQIEYITELESYKIIINIYNNPEMTKLGIPHLKALGDYFFDKGYVLNFKNLHPDFCLSVREMSLFIDYNVTFRNIHANLCQDLSWDIDQPKLCLFDKMSNLDTECVFIFGNLLIGPGDEEHIRKLRIVKRVFGYIKIWNTTLENCYFLRQLEHVVNLDDSVPVMQFLGNQNLQNLQFPFLKLFIVKGNNRVIIDGNHPYAFTKTRYCVAFQMNADTNITYNGGNCKSINIAHPNGTGFDFDDFDYTELSFEYLDDNWKNEYDGDFWYLFFEEKKSVKLYKRLNELNDYVAFIGLIINFFHLIVLFQKELRGNFVYIMMIGISLCDIILASTFLLDWLLRNKVMVPKRNECRADPYWYAMFKLLYDRFLSMARRCSTILAFLMALFRTITVMFPLSITVPKMTRPRVIIILSLACFGVCVAWDAMLVARCQISLAEFTCEGYKNPPPDYYFECPPDDEYDDFTIKIISATDTAEGFSTVIISVLYLTLTIALSYQLIAARKRQRSLKYEKSDATLLLVTMLAVSFFSSELVFGAFYLVKVYWSSKYSVMQGILDELKIICWTFLIINSSIHCLICFFMSTQYRGVARRLFWFKRKENQVDVIFVNRDILEPTVQ